MSSAVPYVVVERIGLRGSGKSPRYLGPQQRRGMRDTGEAIEWLVAAARRWLPSARTSIALRLRSSLSAAIWAAVSGLKPATAHRVRIAVLHGPMPSPASACSR